jgi:23S rRNA pseudouridine2604 synthase
MATLKLKHASPQQPHKAPAREGDPKRPPVRGSGTGVKKRPTLAEAQAQRAEREARYQEQLRQRYGDRPPATPHRGDRAPQPARDSRPNRIQVNTAFSHQPPPKPPRAPDALGPSAARAAPERSPRPQRPDRPRPQSEHAERFHEPLPHTPGSMRLSKRMSELGIASRREADEWIAAGLVRVDGQVVNELGSRVVVGQQVTVDAKARHQQAQRVTVLVNKPVGYVSGQAEDGYEPAFVLVTPQNQWREDHSGTRFLREHLKSLVPAGRLDIDSVGLLVLTQDGRVAKQLIGEDSSIEKEYLVRVELPAAGRWPAESMALLNHGLELDGEALRPARVEWVNDDQMRFVLTQGKKRQIRRMCEAVGLKVLGLKRVRIGAVMLGDLPAGQWRYLRMDEKFS